MVAIFLCFTGTRCVDTVRDGFTGMNDDKSVRNSNKNWLWRSARGFDGIGWVGSW